MAVDNMGTDFSLLRCPAFPRTWMIALDRPVIDHRKYLPLGTPASLCDNIAGRRYYL